MNSSPNTPQTHNGQPLRPVIHVVLPAYNEGKELLNLLQVFQQAIINYNFHILVVDDGSQDHSIQWVEEAHLPYVTVIRHVKNQGLGAAVKTGFLAVLNKADDNDIIMVMDSDGTHPPFLVERMAQLILEGNDVVVASRYRYGSQVIGLHWFRELLSHGSSWIYRFTVPIRNIKDYTCGFRLYQARILRLAIKTYGENFITETGFACMAEILVKLNKIHAICCEVPMILRYDQKMSTSKIKILNTILSSLKLVGRFICISG
jgi:dolichol-phosphate mannosyltransferase